MEVTCVEKNKILCADGIHYQIKFQMIKDNVKENEGISLCEITVITDDTKDGETFEVGKVYEFWAEKH